MELHCFNEWKNCVLNYDINKIKKSIRSEFIKLQNKLRKFIPTKDDLFGFMLDSYTKEDLKNNVKDRELEMQQGTIKSVQILLGIILHQIIFILTKKTYMKFIIDSI